MNGAEATGGPGGPNRPKRRVGPTVGGLRRQKQRTVQGLAAVRAYCEQVFSAETGTAVVGGDYSNGVLTVNCSAAALVQELTQFHREALLTAVRAAVPETARLRIQPA